MKAFHKWLRQWRKAEEGDLKAQLDSMTSRAITAESVVFSLKLDLQQANQDAATQRALIEDMRRKIVPVETEQPFWEDADRAVWAEFLRSATGQKLQAKANFHEQATNRTAVMLQGNAENATGYARGWHMATKYFFASLKNLADVRPEQDTTTEQQPGAAALRERLAP